MAKDDDDQDLESDFGNLENIWKWLDKQKVNKPDDLASQIIEEAVKQRWRVGKVMIIKIPFGHYKESTKFSLN